MKALLLVCLLLAGCGAHHVAATPAPQTPHVFIPSGVPDSVVICVALPARWSCVTVGELRQMFSVQARL